MRFSRPNSPAPAVKPALPERSRVLFVCYGNACRSQMAEGFAKAFHADILEAESAGVAALGFVPEETAASMLERDVSLTGHHSKGLEDVDLRSFDLVVNMSGFPFPTSFSRAVKVVEWVVDDPYTGNQRKYRKVRDDIERRVSQLADSMRKTSE